MNNLFKILFFFTLQVFIFSACEKDSQKNVAIIPEEEIIAVVNNIKIPLSGFQTSLHSFLKHYRQLLKTEEKQMAPIKEIVIDQLIIEELITQEAARKRIEISDAEIESKIAELLNPFQDTNFDRFLKTNNLSEEEWKDQLKYFLLHKKLVEQEVMSKIPITKREIKSYYQKNKKDMISPRAYHIYNITLSTEEEADAIRLKLIRNPRDFKNMAREYSISPDKSYDGDLGFIEIEELPPEMENAIRKLNYVDRLSNVILSQDGFHIFYLKKIRRKRRLNTQEAKPRIKEMLIAQKRDEAYVNWLKKLKKNASISIDKEMLASEEGF